MNNYHIFKVLVLYLYVSIYSIWYCAYRESKVKNNKVKIKRCDYVRKGDSTYKESLRPDNLSF